VDQEYADYFFWLQMLTGDTVDNIPGLPRVGPVKANAILNGVTSYEDLKRTVQEAYKSKFGEAWKEHYLLNGKMLYMWKHWGDHFSMQH